MYPPLRIEVPDMAHAERLRGFLQTSDVETLAVNGHCEVRVGLFDRKPESRVVKALRAIDAWLATAGASSVLIHLDASSYTLHAPFAYSGA